MANPFTLGLDLGQSSDYTATGILQRVDTGYQLRHLARVRHVKYTRIVADTVDLMNSEPLKGKTTLVIDGTGVGRPVVDMFTDAGLRPIVVTLTGGFTVTREGRRYSVPKRDVVHGLLAVFQQDRLEIAKALALASVFVDELTNFRLKVNITTGHDSYEAWRENEHDDLVLAVAMAVWHAERPQGAGWQESKIVGGDDE